MTAASGAVLLSRLEPFVLSALLDQSPRRRRWAVRELRVGRCSVVLTPIDEREAWVEVAVGGATLLRIRASLLGLEPAETEPTFGPKDAEEV